MIEIIRFIIVGAVQGIAEFLPISSSGHLVLIPYIFHWDYQGLSFDIALHFGTLIAILVYFWKDWVLLFKNAFTKGPTEEYPRNLLWQIAVATIPAGIAGVLLSKYEETIFRSPLLIASNLIVFGLVLWAVDKYSKKKLILTELTYLRSFFLGCAQAIALIPGVSRSGITITAGRLIGLNRKNAARFSFLLSTPAILGAFVLSAKDLATSDLNLAFYLGVLSSTIFGFIAIRYLLKYLEKSDFKLFVWYRILIGLLIFGIYFANR